MKNLRRAAMTAAVVLLIYATVSMVKVGSELREALEMSAELKAQICGVKAENDELTYAIENAHTDKAIADAARHRLGLVKSNERIFVFS